MSWVWVGAGLSKHLEVCLVYTVPLQLFLLLPAYPLGHFLGQWLPPIPKMCPEPRCGVTILEFPESATYLDLKTMLLLIEPKMVTGQFCDRITSYSSMAPEVISSPQYTFIVGLKLQFSPRRISKREQPCSRSNVEVET